MATHQLLVGGAAVGVDSGNAMDRCPAWMHDADKLRRGRTFFERHMAAVMFALHSSVLLQFAFDGLRRSAAKMTMGQRVTGHGSCGSRVKKCDPLSSLVYRHHLSLSLPAFYFPVASSSLPSPILSPSLPFHTLPHLSIPVSTLSCSPRENTINIVLGWIGRAAGFCGSTTLFIWVLIWG